LNVRIAPLRDEQGQITSAMGVCRNITEQKRAELILRENQRRLSTLMANLPGMAYRCQNDPRWKMEFVSDGCHALTGYSTSQLLDNDGLTYGDIVHPDDGPMVWESIQAAVAERRRFQIEYRIRTANGDDKWVWEQGVGVFSESGELQAIEGFIADVTSRKRAETQLQQLNEGLEQRVLERTASLTETNERLRAEMEDRRLAERALQQNEAKYRALVESCPDAVAVCDLQWRIVFASPQAAQHHGLSHPDSLLGVSITDLVVQEDRERLLADAAGLLDEGLRRDGLYTGLRRDGSTFPAEAAAALIRDAAGKPVAMVAVYRDITERMKTEEALTIFRRFVEAATQGFGMANLDGVIVYVNPFLARLYGADDPEELVGTCVSQRYPPDYLVRRESEIIPALRRGQSWQGEQMMAFPDGQMHPTIHSIFPVCDDRGELLRTAAIITDITELKRSEAELTSEQQALRRMLLASDHERRLVTYDLHDGVAQQLMGAMMHLQCLQPGRDGHSKADNAYRVGMQALRQAAAELRRVMNRLRTPVLDKFGLVEAIEDVAAQLCLLPDAPTIEFEHGVKFQRLESTLEYTLFRIAQEAITNACRHSRSDRVSVKLTQKSGRVILEVRDWGSGFDQDQIPKNRFGVEGIRERCRILGGTLSIRSSLGKGTTIRVTFPVVELTKHDTP
jgi:PAS domain S-box-containing protein